MKHGWEDGLTNEQYHKDKVHVSSSLLKILIEETPDVFYDKAIAGNFKPSTDAMNLSSLIHHAVLEGDDFIKRYAIKPKFDMRFKDQKKESEDWDKKHVGKVKVTVDELKVIQGCYASIQKHPNAMALLKDCEFERSGYYTDPTTGIPCRIRFDAFDRSNRVLIDLKAVQDATPRGFAKALRDYRWDLSMAMYGQGIFQIDEMPVEQYVFIAVEKTSPYRCAVYELGERSLEAGRQDYFKALSILKECRDTNTYPSLQKSFESIDLPKYFLEEKNV